MANLPMGGRLLYHGLRISCRMGVARYTSAVMFLAIPLARVALCLAEMLVPRLGYVPILSECIVVDVVVGLVVYDIVGVGAVVVCIAIRVGVVVALVVDVVVVAVVVAVVWRAVYQHVCVSIG